MGGSCIKANTDDQDNMKKKQDGPVKHREADKNRVSEDEMKLAEVKSRINKLQQYAKKMDNQIKEQDAKIRRLAKEGSKVRAVIALKHKKYLISEQDKVSGAELLLVKTV